MEEWARAILESSKGRVEQAESSFQRALATPLVVILRSYQEEDVATAVHKGEFLLDYARFLRSVGRQVEANEMLGRAREELQMHCQNVLLRETERRLEAGVSHEMPTVTGSHAGGET